MQQGCYCYMCAMAMACIFYKLGVISNTIDDHEKYSCHTHFIWLVMRHTTCRHLQS